MARKRIIHQHRNMETDTARAASAPRTANVEEQIYTAILNAVLTQQLTANTPLPELTLSRIYAVNRVAVRRALARLATDHVVILRRNQSAVVASPGPENTEQVFAARRHIEAEVMRQTAGALDDRMRQAIEKVVTEEHHAHAESIHEDRIHLSLKFHELLAGACPNRVLGEILQSLILRTSVAVALYKVPGMAACYRATDHRHIADAILAGDGEGAARAANEHLDYLEERLNYATRIRRQDLTAILTG
jgi:DNA-binding GntR family transcriptional regulator